MNLIGFDRKFTLLTQEAHLAKNTLLSGFDLLLKANFFQDKDGYFYSAFFNLSIGMERLLKLDALLETPAKAKQILSPSYAANTKPPLKLVSVSKDAAGYILTMGRVAR